MRIQPPRGHLPAHHAPLYVTALALLEAYPKEGKPTFDPKPFCPGTCPPLGASMTFDGERTSFSVKISGFTPSQLGIELHLKLTMEPRVVPRKIRPSPTVPKPLAIAEYPVIVEGEPAEAERDPPLTDEERAEAEAEEAEARAAEARAKKRAEVAEAAARTPKGVTVTLLAPHDTCLDSKILSATARWHGVRGLRRTAHGDRAFPADAYFRFPRLSRGLVEELRNVLAEGSDRAVLIERTGRGRHVPSWFWHSEAAEAVLAGDVETVLAFGDGGDPAEATGTIWFDRAALDAAWSKIRVVALVPVKPVEDELATEEDCSSAAHEEPAVPEGGSVPSTETPPYSSPYINFLLEVAQYMKMNNGRNDGEIKFQTGDIEKVILKLAEGRTDLGEMSKNKRLKMVTMLRHPSLEGGGNSSAKDAAVIAKSLSRD